MTYNIFIPLNSSHFLNKYLFTKDDQVNSGLIGFGGMYLFIAIFGLISMLWVFSTVSEINDRQVYQQFNFLKILKGIPKFFSNRNILTFVIFLQVKYFGLRMYTEVAYHKLIEFGFPEIQFTFISTLLVPVTI